MRGDGFERDDERRTGSRRGTGRSWGKGEGTRRDAEKDAPRIGAGTPLSFTWFLSFQHSSGNSHHLTANMHVPEQAVPDEAFRQLFEFQRAGRIVLITCPDSVAWPNVLDRFAAALDQL